MIVRTIPNFSRYEISTEGVILNTKTFRIISHIQKNNGYKCVWLYNDEGIRKNCLLHRILMSAFIENPNNLPLVDHIDRNRENNSLTNLRYASYKTNSSNRGKNWNNKYGKFIANYDSRWRVSIKRDGKRIFDKSFSKKRYTLDMVKNIRNQFCLEQNIPITD